MLNMLYCIIDITLFYIRLCYVLLLCIVASQHIEGGLAARDGTATPRPSPRPACDTL